MKIKFFVIIKVIIIIFMLNKNMVHSKEENLTNSLLKNPISSVELSANSVTINQKMGKAKFLGDVSVNYGDLKLYADSVNVSYNTSQETYEKIKIVVAEGNVVVKHKNNYVRGNSANYDVTAEIIIIEGEVFLTRNNSTISGQKLILNIKTGDAQMEGPVTTIFRQEEEG